MDLELVVVQALPAALAARTANPAMPLVIVTGPGLVGNGFARTIEHPGGNATGIDELPPGVTARRLELLKTAAPAVSRVALLSTTPGRGGHEAQLADAQEAASKLGVTVKPYRANSLVELEHALGVIAAESMNGLLNFQGGLSFVNRQLIVNFAASHRIPGSLSGHGIHHSRRSDDVGAGSCRSAPDCCPVRRSDPERRKSRRPSHPLSFSLLFNP